MAKTIKGTVTFQNIETGFWGIIDSAGEKWMIINMPEQLKYDGKKVTVTIQPIDAMSTMMWGNPAEIISFGTGAP
ncbi:MAG: hypothetical protein ACI8P3_002273 [Saprospiraceae bacterium]|jgi:hypothetical protein